MPLFQFQCGDIVALKAADADTLPPPRFIVLERLTQECSGGVQRHYLLRSFRTNDAGSMSEASIRVLDMEVEAYPTQEQMEQRCREQAAIGASLHRIRKEAGDAARQIRKRNEE